MITGAKSVRLEMLFAGLRNSGKRAGVTARTIKRFEASKSWLNKARVGVVTVHQARSGH